MSIWQTNEWGNMLLASNQAKNIFNIEGFQIEKRKIGMGEYGFFILGIDSIKNFYKKGNEFLKKIKLLAKKEKVLFIQIETLNYYKSNLDYIENDKFKKGFYKKFITPYTAVIDLKKTKDEILKNMKPKGRYNIRLAEKKGVTVKEVEKTKENIEKYYNLMLETTSRDNFSGNSIDYYTTFLKKLESSKLLLAYINKKVIAGGIFIFNEKVSIYYYGASSSNPKYRNLMAPYLLQWEAIKIAKDNGSRIYDFLGVSSPTEKNSSLKGVTNFKKKLTPDIKKVSISYIWINNKFKYYLLIIIRKIKNIFK